MWIAAERGEKPSTYREPAVGLAEKIGGYEDFLKGLAAFRNIVIHRHHLDDAKELEEASNALMRELGRSGGRG